ncbi:sensor histidine kinase [Pseudogracilibacillus auburnensis]|uniref:histidine kinase n=1 Tax=Pseudogracilibacillus auburnensis TaxID=1494959 RepID=A0A2V3VYL8_9BACI|nr:histidine kinase [Pseudogracilibacillus auburnensis]PXW86962.1 signal transduction histidine kinase [Pseudogracilibacillus auburnensis]
MQEFFIRFVLFVIIWILMIYETSSQLTLSFFMLTASLALFFFLSKRDISVYVYGILSMVIFLHGLIIHDFLYSSLLLLLITTMATFRLSNIKNLFLLIVNLLFSCSLLIPHLEYLVPVLLVWGFYAFLLIKLNKMELLRKEQKEIYEQLLAEYRHLKRMHIASEEVTKAEERTRIAREIHDSVGHRLTALIMKLEMLHIQHPNEQYIDLKQMANESLNETRQAVQTLQESETKGITAVVQLIRKLEAESQLLIQFTIKDGVLSIPLSNEHGIVLYRVIQEALTNVMRHASSKHVHISIGKSAIHTLAFSITNPMTNKEKFEFGFGLSNMIERVKEVEGQIEIYQTDEEFVIQGMMPYK